MLSREEIKQIKEQYPKDTQVRLFSMKGEPQMPSGMSGKVRMVDDIGQIHVLWENGSTLPINTEEDQFEIITPQEMVAEETPQMNGPQ